MAKYTLDTMRKLYTLSGNTCAFPNCNLPILDEDLTYVGQIAHIEAESQGGPRYNPKKSNSERNGYDNLILLCRPHHAKIDSEVSRYTVEELLKMKKQHEQEMSRKSRSPSSEQLAAFLVIAEKIELISEQTAETGRYVKDIHDMMIGETPRAVEESLAFGFTPNPGVVPPFDKNRVNLRLDEYDELTDPALKEGILDDIRERTRTLSAKNVLWDEDRTATTDRILGTFAKEENQELKGKWLTIIEPLTTMENDAIYKKVKEIVEPVIKRELVENPGKNAYSVAHLLQRFDNYSPESAIELIQRGINSWTEDQFGVLEKNIDFHKVEANHPGFMVNQRRRLLLAIDKKENTNIDRMKKILLRIDQALEAEESKS